MHIYDLVMKLKVAGFRTYADLPSKQVDLDQVVKEELVKSLCNLEWPREHPLNLKKYHTFYIITNGN